MPSQTKINCLNCQKETYVETREINRGHGKFCSRICSQIFKKGKKKNKIPNVECAYCKCLFYICPSKQKNSKSGLYFCCRSHKDLAQRIGGIQEIMPTHYGTASADDNKHYRRIVFINKPKKCERCGFDKHEAAIIIHHKDRNRLNDSLDNLEVLCANCHAIEHWG